MNLSAIVITKNEASSIGMCLKALAFADERIVIDAESNDATVDIAKSSGATVYINPWPGYGAQKNYGMQKARGDWVLFIDADEEVTPKLAQEIQQAVKSGTCDFYWLKIVTVFLGKPLTHLFGHNPRLFKKSSGRWQSALVHEQVEHIDEEITITLGDQHSAKLVSHLLHHSHASISSYLASMHQYTLLDAQEMGRSGHHRSGRPVSPHLFLPLMLALRQGVKLLVYRRGFLDGLPGIIWCMLSAYYEWEMAHTYLALRSKKIL